MIRCIVISPDAKLREALILGLEATPGVALLRTLDHHPQSTEAGRLLDSLCPEAIFIHAGQPEDVKETSRRLEELAPDTALIGVDWTVTSASLLEAMQAGLRDFVAAPFTPGRLEEALERAADSGFARRAAIGSSNHIYSFIPAKAGAGASTLATNTAVALAARNPRDTLLMDFDWSSGVIGLSLNLAPSSLSPAAGREETAESLWLSRILRHGHLDVFPNTPEAALELLRNYRARNLLRMARNHYKTSIIDLAGEYDEDAYAVLKQSHMIFLVTTPELPSLRLAHERIALLTAEGLGHRVELIVNRSGPVHREQIEDLLGFPVYFEFPNHYRAVNTALQHGLPVGAMGLHFARFAALISGDPAGREEPPAGSWLPWAEMREELTKAFGRRYS